MGLQRNASGQDTGRNLSFRMDTDIYADVTKPPLKRSTTLFLEGGAMTWSNRIARK